MPSYGYHTPSCFPKESVLISTDGVKTEPSSFPPVNPRGEKEGCLERESQHEARSDRGGGGGETLLTRASACGYASSASPASE